MSFLRSDHLGAGSTQELDHSGAGSTQELDHSGAGSNSQELHWRSGGMMCTFWIQTGWTASTSYCNCLSRNDSGSHWYSYRYKGYETQSNELLVEVDKRR